MANGFLEEKISFRMQAFTLSLIEIQINNKTIIESGSPMIYEIIKASACVFCFSLRLRQITQISALIIPHILHDLIQ